MPAYKDEKRGTWYAKFSYTDWTGKVRWTTKRGFRTKREAVSYEHDFKSQSSVDTSITLRALVALYIENEEHDVKPSTLKVIKSRLNTHILPLLGDMKVSELTPARLLKWKNHLLNATYYERQISSNTVADAVALLNSVFRYAIRYHGFTTNPLENIRVPKKNTEMLFWEEDEFTRFLSCVEDTGLRCAFLILFYGGLRVGELKGLEVTDFDFTANKINIDKSYSPHTKTALSTKTTSSRRTVAMPPEIMTLVHDYLHSFYESPSPAFANVGIPKMRYAIKTRSAVAGVKPIRIHDLRHSHASYLINKGVSITAISKRLGHTSPKMTLDTYSHLYKNEDEGIANIISGSILGQAWVKRQK